MDLQKRVEWSKENHLSHRGEQFYRQLLCNVSEELSFSQDVMWEMGPYSKADFSWLFRASGPLAPITRTNSRRLGGNKALCHVLPKMQGNLSNQVTSPPILPPVQTIHYKRLTTNKSSAVIPDQQGPSDLVKHTGLRRVSRIYQPFKTATTDQHNQDSQSMRQIEPVLKEQNNTTVQWAVSKQFPRQGHYKAGSQSLLKDQCVSKSATDLVIKELIYEEDFCDTSKPRLLQNHNAETPQLVCNRVQDDISSAVCVNDQGVISETANNMHLRQMEIPKSPCIQDNPISFAGKKWHHTENNFELEHYSEALGRVPDRWITPQCLKMERDTSKDVIESLLGQCFHSGSPSDQKQATALLASISSKTTLVRLLLAEKLNSPNWKDRVLACNTISQLKCPINKDLTSKLLYLTWNDQIWIVRQEARQALEKLGLTSEIQNDLRVKLASGSASTRVEALVLIGQLKIMTAKLLPSFLHCLNDDFGVVREQACVTAACLRINDEMILNQLIKLMKNDPSCNVKIAAINALEKIGCMPPKLQEQLLWALYHEEEPKVRIAACEALKSLGFKTPEQQNHLDTHPPIPRNTVHLMESYGYSLDRDKEIVRSIKQQVQQLCTTSIITDKVLLLEELQQQRKILGNQSQADATLMATLLQERLKGSENKPKLLFHSIHLPTV